MKSSLIFFPKHRLDNDCDFGVTLLRTALLESAKIPSLCARSISSEWQRSMRREREAINARPESAQLMVASRYATRPTGQAPTTSTDIAFRSRRPPKQWYRLRRAILAKASYDRSERVDRGAWTVNREA